MANFPSKLSSGAYGKLEFDFACNRGHNFGEVHLHGVLNEIATSYFDSRTVRVETGYPATAIQKKSGGRGRKRELDLAVVELNSGRVSHALEAKWAGSTYCSPETILIDLCRLAAVSAADPEATCLFVLAGRKDKVAKILSTGILATHQLRGGRLLSYPYGGRATNFYLSRADLGDLRRKMSGLFHKAPDRISTLLHKPSHDDTPFWTVLVWRVRA